MSSRREKPENRSSNGWIRACFWKYALKSSLPSCDSTLRGERHPELAFQALNGESFQGRNSARVDYGLRASMRSDLPSNLLAKECNMNRVDPDCVDCLFAEYDGNHWTGTSDLQPSIVDQNLERELLTGMEAIIDFIQAAQSAPKTETQPAPFPSKKRSARR